MTRRRDGDGVSLHDAVKVLVLRKAGEQRCEQRPRLQVWRAQNQGRSGCHERNRDAAVSVAT